MMRNTPYPAHTIGKRSHDLFPLSKTTGLLQGIVDIDKEGEVVKVDGIRGFELLEVGAVETFPEGARLEIVEFGGEHLRGGFASQILVREVSLEPGGRLTGPAAWRMAPTPVDVGSVEKKGSGELSGRGTFWFCAFLLVVWGLTALMAIEVAVVTGGMFLVICLVALIGSLWSGSRQGSIVELGSVYVLAPERRMWA